MHTLVAWILFFHNCLMYLLYRLRLRGPIDLRDYTPWWDAWLGSVFGWKKGLRIRGMENCPQEHPMLITGNHVKLEDPFCYWVAVYRATGAKVSAHFLMRDDFFQGKPWDMLPIDIDEIARFGGGLPISRGSISLGQLRPILRLLCQPASLIMFPGRTRTRSGLLIEYPEGLEEPGSPAFLMAQVQRKQAELSVALLPVCRTWNPVTGGSVMSIGVPRYLSTHADRITQRSLDHNNLLDIAQLVEVHAPHIVALYIYLLAHHAGDVSMQKKVLCGWVQEVVEKKPHAFVDPELEAGNIEVLLDNALYYFQKADMLHLKDELICIDSRKIRHVPEITPKFRKENPVQFLVNQVLHLENLCSLVEESVAGYLQSCSRE